MTHAPPVSSRNRLKIFLHGSGRVPIYTDAMGTPTNSTAPKQTDELAAVIEGVPGVDDIYPATPVLATVVKEVVGAITRKPVAPQLVSLTESSAGLTASVSIGIADADAATDVCRRVYDSIAEFFTAAGDPAVTAIEVKVARIG